MRLSTDSLAKMYELCKKNIFFAVVCSLKYFKAIRKMAAQYVCILLYEFSLNFVKIATKFANCQRYDFVVRDILKLFARWQRHIRL